MPNLQDGVQKNDRDCSSQLKTSGRKKCVRKWLRKCLYIEIIVCILVRFVGGYFFYGTGYAWHWMVNNWDLERFSTWTSLIADATFIVGVFYSTYKLKKLLSNTRELEDYLDLCDKITKTISDNLTEVITNELKPKQIIDRFDSLFLFVKNKIDDKVEKREKDPSANVEGIINNKGKGKDLARVSEDWTAQGEKSLLKQLYDDYDMKIKKRINLDGEIRRLKELQRSFNSVIKQRYSDINKARQELDRNYDRGPAILQKQGDISLRWILKPLQRPKSPNSTLNKSKQLRETYEVSSKWINENLQKSISVSLESETLQKRVLLAMQFIEDYLKQINTRVDEIRVRIFERMSYLEKLYIKK